MDKSKKWDKENIMLIEYENHIGDEVYKYAALYNKRKLTEEEVLDSIRADERPSGLITMERERYESVFLAGEFEDSEEDDDNEEDYEIS